MKIPRMLMKIPLTWIITSVLEIASPLLIYLLELYSVPTVRMSYPKDKSYHVDPFPTAKPPVELNLVVTVKVFINCF